MLLVWPILDLKIVCEIFEVFRVGMKKPEVKKPSFISTISDKLITRPYLNPFFVKKNPEITQNMKNPWVFNNLGFITNKQGIREMKNQYVKIM